jgi:hypothetical protein
VRNLGPWSSLRARTTRRCVNGDIDWSHGTGVSEPAHIIINTISRHASLQRYEGYFLYNCQRDFHCGILPLARCEGLRRSQAHLYLKARSLVIATGFIHAVLISTEFFAERLPRISYASFSTSIQAALSRVGPNTSEGPYLLCTVAAFVMHHQSSPIAASALSSIWSQLETGLCMHGPASMICWSTA